MARSGSGLARKSTNVRFTMSRVAAVGALRLLGDSLPSVSGPVADWLWRSPGRHERPEREAEVLARGQAARIPLGVHGLRAWSWGEGPTVLLVHGWEGRGSQLGSFVDPLVEAGFRVVAFDAPGHGDSGGDRSSLFSFSDAVDAAARRFGPLYGIVAHSMGAAASAYSLLGGVTATRVVFVAPADAGQALGRFALQTGMGEQTQAWLADTMVRRYGLPIDALAARELAPHLPADLLVIHDRDDGWVPMSDGQAYAAGRGAELMQTEGLGHHRVLRDPAVIERTVAYLAEGAGDVVGGAHWPMAVPPVHKPWYSFELEIEMPEITDEELQADLRFGRD